MQQSNLFYSVLGTEQNGKKHPDVENSIVHFQKSYGLILPKDLQDFFSIAYETQYNEKMYRFFSLKDFKGIDEELRNFDGSPDYSNIINTLVAYKDCFVFADYMFHMFSYAIRLSKYESETNDIYIICGDKYKIIASSFTEFLHLYLSESIKLHFED